MWTKVGNEIRFVEANARLAFICFNVFYPDMIVVSSFEFGKITSQRSVRSTQLLTTNRKFGFICDAEVPKEAAAQAVTWLETH